MIRLNLQPPPLVYTDRPGFGAPHHSHHPWHCLKQHVLLNGHQCEKGSEWISHYEITSGGTILSQILQRATKGSLFLKAKQNQTNKNNNKKKTLPKFL